MAELTVLPAALLIRDRRRSRENLHTTLAIRLDFLEWVHCRPRSVLTALAIITVLALPGLARLKFDHNLLDLQARGLESVTYELKLMTETDQSTWFTPFIAESAGAAVSLAERVSQTNFPITARGCRGRHFGAARPMRWPHLKR
ncbi:MAG: hypothetical protein HYV03_01475 [Deltaproteobacteria bacterium]|nr:hypothetical protein [Deltaproteobacteria bacterium]